jgi:S1-C subfamily serine protease
MKTHWIFPAFVFFASTIAADCEDLGYTGRVPPQGLSTTNSRIEITNWDSFALDGFSGKTAINALAKKITDSGALNVRGRKESEIYRNSSGAVVMIVTDKGLGSGTYLGADQILTNWHVVQSASAVGILFKPTQEGAPIQANNVVRGDVVRVDVSHDLALIKVAVVPQNIRPLELGNEEEIQIGADVSAIGHPTGEAWTYTRGLISQFRRGYDWKASDIAHHADVIQTQTPINPGNSGGPLIGDSGKVLGVNSFKVDGESLNFAVSVGEVWSFLGKVDRQDAKRTPLTEPSCRPVKLYEGRNQPNDANLVSIDTNCDGISDFFVLTPDNQSKPVQALIDSNYDGKIDIFVYARNREGRWDFSYWDTTFTGVIDLVGFHPDGKIKPSRFEKYDPKKQY